MEGSASEEEEGEEEGESEEEEEEEEESDGEENESEEGEEGDGWEEVAGENPTESAAPAASTPSRPNSVRARRSATTPGTSSSGSSTSTQAPPDVTPVSSMHALITRFAAANIHLPDVVESFVPEESRLSYHTHLEQHKLLGVREDDAAIFAAEAGPVVYNVSAPMQDCAWFLDLSDRALNALLALPVKERTADIFVVKNAQIPEQNGYSRAQVLFCDTDAQIHERAPPLDHSPPAPAHPDAPPVAPARVRVPPRMPHLGRIGVGCAAKIIKQFEEVVVDGDEVYSPMRLWTLEHRRVHNGSGELMSQTTLFGRRCRTYVWVRFISDIADFSACAANESSLRKSADEWHKTLSAPEKDMEGYALAMKYWNELAAWNHAAQQS